MPPRAMWKGAISFGLVTIPVAVFPATEEKSLKFNQLHDEDMGRIRYKRVCSVDGEEVDYEHIVKGYEIEKDKYVVLTDDDLDAVPVESSPLKVRVRRSFSSAPVAVDTVRSAASTVHQHWVPPQSNCSADPLHEVPWIVQSTLGPVPVENMSTLS